MASMPSRLVRLSPHGDPSAARSSPPHFVARSSWSAIPMACHRIAPYLIVALIRKLDW